MSWCSKWFRCSFLSLSFKKKKSWDIFIHPRLALNSLSSRVCMTLSFQSFMPLPVKYWDYRCLSPCPTSFLCIWLFSQKICVIIEKGGLIWLGCLRHFSKYQLANIEIPLVLTCKSSTVYYLAASKLNS